MRGMNASTGRAISGVAHLCQSVAKIITTWTGTCIARREFGSEVPALIDAANNEVARVRLYAATAGALMRWEPRLHLTRVRLSADETETGAGVQVIDIEGWTTESGEPVSTRVQLANGGMA